MARQPEGGGITWTNETWTPIRARSAQHTGHFCEKISAGCKNCYASRMQPRFGMFPYLAENRPKVELFLDEKMLLKPLTWKTPKRIFVCSMTDLFYEGHPDEWIDKVFAVAAMRPQHTFQILTKRPERMLAWASRSEMSARIQTGKARVRGTPWGNGAYPKWPLPNVHLGVSCENQEAADKRIPLLLQTPAAVRFISAEPLLGPIDFSKIVMPDGDHLDTLYNDGEDAGLDWVIVGGESGPGARPMHPEWARDLRDQCKDAGVPFFFKQWGEWTPGENVEQNTGVVAAATWGDGHWFFDREDLSQNEGRRDDEPDLYRIGTKAAGATLDGREWHEFPECAQSNPAPQEVEP